MSDHPDAARLHKLADDFLDSMSGLSEAVDCEIGDISLDEIMIVAMAAYPDSDGDACEQAIMRCTSKRPFVQLGLLEAAVIKQRGNYS